MKPSKYLYKNEVVYAIQLLEDTFADCLRFVGEEKIGDGTSQDEICIVIDTPNKTLAAYEEDWIVLGRGSGDLWVYNNNKFARLFHAKQ